MKTGRFGGQPERPFFRCVATPDVLAIQQVTPVWQAPFSASVHTLAVLAVLLNLSPSPFGVRFLRQHEHFLFCKP